MLLIWRVVVVALLAIIAASTCGCGALLPARRSDPSVTIRTSCGPVGSGVVVGERHVLTAAHILVRCPIKPIWVVDSGNHWRVMTIEILRPIPDIDVARLVLVMGERYGSPSPTITTVAVGERVCAEVAFPTRKRVCGKVENITNRTEGGIRVDFPIEQGNSGSPVYSARGLVGLVVECDYDEPHDRCLTTGGNVTGLAGRAGVLP